MVRKGNRPEENPNGGDGSGAQVSTMVKGTPEDVTKAHEQLGPSKEPTVADQEGKGKDEKFFDLLANTEGHRVIARRLRPLQLNNKTLQRQTYIGETPLDMYDIEETIKATFGGNVWAISITDPKTSRKVGGKTLEIYEAPKPVFEEQSEQEEEVEYPTPEQYSEDQETDPNRMLNQQIKHKRQMEILKQLNQGDSGDGVVEKLTNAFNQKFDSLRDGYESRLKSMEDRQREERHKEDIEKIKQGNDLKELKQELAAKNEALMSRMESMMKEASGNKSSTQENFMTKMIEVMTHSTDSKIASMGENQKSTMDMMKSLFTQVAQRNDSLEMVEKVLGVVGGAKDMLGLGAGEPQDLASRITDGLTKLAPQIMDYLKERQAKGEDVSQDTIKGKFKEMGKEIAENITKDIPGMVKKEIGEPSPKQVPNPPSGQVQNPSSQKPIAPTGNVEAAIKARVDNTLRILLQEAPIRPRKAQWIEYAIENLPEDLLEKIALAKTQDELFNLLKEHADSNLITTLVTKLALDPKGQEWVKEGFDILIAVAKGEEPPEETTETPPVTPPATPPSS